MCLFESTTNYLQYFYNRLNKSKPDNDRKILANLQKGCQVLDTCCRKTA